MGSSYNKVTLLGNLGKDPEVRTTPSGSQVASFSVATAEKYKDKNSGEWKEVTDWHNIVMWDKLAEIAGQYLKKGSKVFIEGKLKTRSYEKDGQTKYITEVLGQNLVMLSPRDPNSSSSYSENRREESISQVESDADDDLPF